MERSFADAAQRQGLEYTIIGGVDAQPPANLVPRVVKRLVHGSGYASDPIEWSKRLRGREARELCDAVLSALDQVPGLEPERTTFFLYHGHPLHIPALIRLGLALSGRSPIVLNLYHLHHIYGLHRPKRVPGLRELLQYTRELRRAANVHLFVDSERLGEMIEADTNLSAFVRRLASLQHTKLSPLATCIWMTRLSFFRYRYRLASLVSANTYRLFFISRWPGGTSGSLQLRYHGGLRNFRKLPSIVWNTRGVTEVELRLGAHDGFPLERGGARGSIWTAVLIPEGAQIFFAGRF